MATSNDIKAAYEKLEAAKEELYLKEEARIEAILAREKAFMAAMDRARVEDEITDPGKLQQRGERGSRAELTDLHIAEKSSRKAQHDYTMAGIRVDSLNKQIEAEKLALQR